MFLNLINQYNLTTNAVMLLMAIAMLCLITYSKPEFTWMLRICVVGFVTSAFQIVVHAAILFIICNPRIFSEFLFDILYIMFAVGYAVILCCIMSYICLLSYKLRMWFSRLNHLLELFFLFCVVFMLYPMATGKLVDYNDGVPYLTTAFDAYLFCGLITLAMTVLMVQIHKRTMQKAVYVGVMAFVPMEIIGFMVQAHNRFDVISASTYVTVFAAFFILFHSAKYDETIGCQGDHNLYPYLDRLIKDEQKYLLVYCNFPLIQKREFAQILESMVFTTAKACRAIETRKRNARIYRRNSATYLTLVKVDSDEEKSQLIEDFEAVFDVVRLDNGKLHSPVYKMIAVSDYASIDSARKVKSLIDYMTQQFIDKHTREFITVDQEILDKFEIYYKVEQELLDIFVKHDLNDPRVICLAQPIYRLRDNGYWSAEALMRMEFDGKVYFPDQFIPVAETNDCIHMLTLIMINKVCKSIKELEKTCKFNAITINCSTMEVQKGDFADEVLEIIRMNNVKPSQIRLEITESVDIKDYSGVLANMQRLKEEGVKFYLDDFGTGFSNLERIVSYPFMTIKFDKSILYRALHDTQADALLKLLVKFFSDNGFIVLVEGVEDEDNLAYVKAAGFQYVQGYYFAKPVPIMELVNYFGKNE